MQNIENDTRYRAADLGALLARHYPQATAHSIALVVFQMQNAARAAKKFSLDRCNYDLGEKAEARRDRAQDRKEAAINATLGHSQLISQEFWGAEGDCLLTSAKRAIVALGGDPRGPCARLTIPGLAGDGWGEGFAIY